VLSSWWLFSVQPAKERIILLLRIEGIFRENWNLKSIASGAKVRLSIKKQRLSK